MVNEGFSSDDWEDDDYPHADGLGGYQRQDGEYVRPEGSFRLPVGEVEHDASATDIYGRSLLDLDHDGILEVELVPEPLNVFDRYAVCLDVMGVKVGYLGAYFAEYWHPVIMAFNRIGLHVLVRSEVIDDGGGFPGLNLLMPDWPKWTVIAAEAGYESGFDALWQRLPEHCRLRLIDEFGVVDGSELQSIRALSHLMPDAAWDRGGLPAQVLTEVRNRAIASSQQRDRERAADLARWEAERAALRREVHSLRTDGLTFVAIGQRLGISAKTASALFKESLSAPVD